MKPGHGAANTVSPPPPPYPAPARPVLTAAGLRARRGAAVAGLAPRPGSWWPTARVVHAEGGRSGGLRRQTAASVVFFSWLLPVTHENLMRHLGLLPSESMEEAYLA